MNLQRREEIRTIAKEFRRLFLHEQAEAIDELLAHVDTLEQAAAERVIARGAVVKPHTFGEIVNQVRDIAIQYAGTEQLRERIVYALAPHFESDAGPTPDYTGEGSAWVPPVEARVVVVPSYVAMADVAWKNHFDPLHGPTDMFAAGLTAMHKAICAELRAIPADRALGDGVVAVPPVEVPAAVVPESLLHDLAVAAWDEGADAGMVWDPDADPAKRGVVPCTPEEGIAKARDHFARHGSGSPGSAFSRALQAIRENSRAIPAGHVLGDGNQFGVGFVEACGMLAAKPFDRPTLAAGLIREGGMVSALAETSSDGPGISVLRVEMRTDLDALRANQGGVAT